MRIRITNQINGYSAEFWTFSDMEAIYGYASTRINYRHFVNETKIFRINNISGFYDNNTVNPYSTRGVNEDGVNFKANHFSEKILNINFVNEFGRTSQANPPLSPNNYLNSLILIKNDTILVEAETAAGLHKMECFVTSATSTEAGVINLASAKGGNGAFWQLGDVSETYKWFNLDYLKAPNDYTDGFVEGELPKQFDRAVYPFRFPMQSTATSLPAFSFYCYENGFFELITFKNLLTGDTCSYNNTYKDKKITINSETLEVINENGVSRIENFTGDFIIFYGGINELEIKHNNKTLLDEANAYLGLNTFFNIKYKNYVSSIEEILEDC